VAPVDVDVRVTPERPVTGAPGTPLRPAGTPPAIAPRPDASDAETVHRVTVVLAALGLLGPAFAIWAGIVPLHITGLAAGLVTVGALGALVAAAAARTETALRRVELGLLLLGLLALAGWAFSVVAANPAYGTDEAAFEQYAATLLMHGGNPYAHSLLPALREFQVPIQYATYTTSGGVVATLGYPALPVLFVVPFVWLTGGVQAVPVADVTALALAMVTTFLVLPRRFRALSVVVVVALPILFGYSVAGVNAILALPLLAVVAWRFTETGAGGRLGGRGALQAVCFGLALSVQQIVWFLAPFVVVAIWVCRRHELGASRAAGVLGRYLGLAAVAFGAVNAGFVAANPSAWLHGIAGPLLQHAIPYGQGLIDLPVFAGIGGGDLGLYTVGALALLVGLLVCYRLYFTRLWRCAFILPSLALFFPTRSLAEYWATLVSVWIVSVFAGPPPRPGQPAEAGRSGLSRLLRRPWARTGVAAAAFLPGALVIGAALMSASPLSMRILRIGTNGQFQRVWELTVRVRNHGSQPLRPHFAMNSSGQMTPFWHRLAGPATLAPGASATYLLAAPNVGSMPGITEPFQLDAVTSSPESISVTRNVTTDPYATWIYQSDVNRVLPFGRSTRLTVQLRSPLGSRVERAGVRVELGQIIYAEGALIPGEARINGDPEGRSPVALLTNRAGEATFTVTDISNQHFPLYFQAWAVGPGGYPFGYSEVVDVLWAGGGGR
jgi:hypothetical protein